MKLMMTLLVRDEEDIIEENLKFHLSQGVDEIVVIDNGSVDGTRDILEEFVKAKVATVFDELQQDYSQGLWVTKAALYARDEKSADWIIHNDADEFWVPRTSDLKKLVTSAKSDILRCRRFNMITSVENLEQIDWKQNLVYRVSKPVPRPRLDNFLTDSLPAPYFYMDLPGKVMTRTTDLVSISQGNHNASFGREYRIENAELDIYHFPVRSVGAFTKKVIQGGQAYQKNKNLPKTAGWHWRRWYKLYTDQGIYAALSDALPSQSMFQSDLRNNILVEDHRSRIFY